MGRLYWGNPWFWGTPILRNHHVAVGIDQCWTPKKKMASTWRWAKSAVIKGGPCFELCMVPCHFPLSHGQECLYPPLMGKNDTISYPLLYIPLHPILYSHDFNPRYFLAWNFPSFPTSPPDFQCSTLARSFLVSHHRWRQATLPSRRLEGRLWRWVLPEKEHASNILQNNIE